MHNFRILGQMEKSLRGLSILSPYIQGGPPPSILIFGDRNNIARTGMHLYRLRSYNTVRSEGQRAELPVYILPLAVAGLHAFRITSGKPEWNNRG